MYNQIKQNRKKLIPFEQEWQRAMSDPEERALIIQELIEMELIRNLKNCRKKKKLTQKALAELADVPPATISRIESGQRLPRVETLVKLAYVMGQKLVFADLN